jgi:thymidylate synthase
MRSYSFKTSSEAYLAVLKDVLDNPEYVCAPRDQKIFEVTNAVVEILQPSSKTMVTLDAKRNDVMTKYSEREHEVYYSMSNKAEDFARISKFWDSLKNPDGTINSSYVYLIKGIKDHGNPVFEAQRGNGVGEYRSPWDWSLESLKRDKDTRQAIMRFSRPEHQYFGNADQTCTLDGVWQIRGNCLNLSVNMRSNDLFVGTAYDWPFLMGLMDEMLEDLKPTYPDLIKGKYVHIARSLHVYDRNVEAINKMLGR